MTSLTRPEAIRLAQKVLDTPVMVTLEGIGPERGSFVIDEVAMLARYILAQEEEGAAWQPIDSAPKDGTVIEYFHERCKIPSLCHWEPFDEGIGNEWWDESMTECVEPKWWRPWNPPTAPKSDAGG